MASIEEISRRAWVIAVLLVVVVAAAAATKVMALQRVGEEEEGENVSLARQANKRGGRSLQGMWRFAQVASGAPTARHEACAAMVNGEVVLAGGRGANKPTDIYNPATRRWRRGAGPGPGVEIHHCQCVAAGGKLWIVSSWTGNYPRERNNARVYAYDVRRDRWQTWRGLPAARRRGGGAAVRRGAWIYVVAGNRGGHGAHSRALSWVDAFNWQTRRWRRPGTLPNLPGPPRDHVGGALLKGQLCIAGGRNGGTPDFFNRNIPDVYCYQFNRRRWVRKPDMPAPRAGASTAIAGCGAASRMVVAGGEGNSRAYARVDVFDGVRWTQAPSLVRARHGSGLAVAACACGHLFIPSGSGAQGGAPELRSTELFIPKSAPRRCAKY